MARAIIPTLDICEACRRYAYLSPIEAQIDDADNIGVIFCLCDLCVAELTLVVSRRMMREQREVN
jgi:hypothetical protein